MAYLKTQIKESFSSPFVTWSCASRAPNEVNKTFLQSDIFTH